MSKEQVYLYDFVVYLQGHGRDITEAGNDAIEGFVLSPGELTFVAAEPLEDEEVTNE